MRPRSAALASALALFSSVASAGPPYLTDDPEPTDTGHWEIYGPYLEAEGRGPDFEGSTGVEINYGAAKDLQLTLGLPLAFEHDASGLTTGAGDLELSAKWRFWEDKQSGLQAAFFPGVTLPTGTNGLSAEKVTALLPLWFQKDSGKWSIFGGGGYAINPGQGNRNFWTGALAITRQLSDRLSAGIEVQREGADSVGGGGVTRLGVGGIYTLGGPFRLLASAGPSFTDRVPGAGFHSFIALGIDY